MAVGIETRHGDRCRSRDGARCNCKPKYRAVVWDARAQRRLTKTFPREAAAKAWRADTITKLREGKVSGAHAPTVDDAIAQWLQGAEKGAIRTRGKQTFKPATLRAVRQNHKLRLKDRFGDRRLDQIQLRDLQEYCDELDADGLSPSTIESTMLPLRMAYRHFKARGIIAVDPTDGLELAKPTRGSRVPPAPEHAFKLLDAAPEEDRALWGTAMLAGLRRGELMALRWSNVDLGAGTIKVEQSYDPTSCTFVTPKSKYGVRSVPIPKRLSPLLREHMLRSGRRTGLVFGVSAEVPFPASSVQERADEAWKTAKLERVTPHACRHMYASISIAAGVNAHALCKYMGHSSIQVTFDLYGHLFPGNEAQAAALLDAHLDKVLATDER